MIAPPEVEGALGAVFTPIEFIGGPLDGRWHGVPVGPRGNPRELTVETAPVWASALDEKPAVPAQWVRYLLAPDHEQPNDGFLRYRWDGGSGDVDDLA